MRPLRISLSLQGSLLYEKEDSVRDWLNRLTRGSHALAVDPHPLRRPGAAGTTYPRAALHRSLLQNTRHTLNNSVSTCIDPSRFRQNWPPHLLFGHCLLRPRQSRADRQNFCPRPSASEVEAIQQKKRVGRFYNCPTCSTPHLPRERATTLATMGRKRTKERHTGTRMRDQDLQPRPQA